jgi:hypothetical protein
MPHGVAYDRHVRRCAQLLLLILANCGPPKDQSSADAGGDPPEPGCPFFEPKEQSRCPEIGLQCEFGSDDRIACNSVATCTDIGWITTAPDERCTPNDEGCPDDAVLIARGGPCDALGITCSYPTGTCACDGKFKPGGSDLEFTWTCTDPGPGCEPIRPHLGGSCFEEGKVCSYGGCSLIVHNVTQKCVGGVWRSIADQCGGDAGLESGG